LDLKDPVVVVPVVVVVVAASLACTLALCGFAVAARATLARTPAASATTTAVIAAFLEFVSSIYLLVDWPAFGRS